MIDAAGKPGCTVVMTAAVLDAWDRVHHPSYPEVWERELSETRDPYEISARFEERFARHPEHIDAYRHRFAFHPIHGILARRRPWLGRCATMERTRRSASSSSQRCQRTLTAPDGQWPV